MINTKEYIEVTLWAEDYTSEKGEIIEAFLSDLPYDTFMEDVDAYGKAVLKAYIPQAQYDARALKICLSMLEFKVDFKAEPVAPTNWNAEWESNFEPIFVDNKVTVKAPYHKDLKRSRFNITIEPQMAFGTGHHQTTYMMMESMLEYEEQIRSHAVMDMGCGTAVLGILAAKMGASKVYGIDIDAVAAQSGFDNARLNRIGKKIDIYCGDASLLQKESYDVLLANIHKNIIIQDMRTYADSLRKKGMRYKEGKSDGGLLLVSGFYEGDIPEIADAASKHGLSAISQKVKEDWACIVFKKN